MCITSVLRIKESQLRSICRLDMCHYWYWHWSAPCLEIRVVRVPHGKPREHITRPPLSQNLETKLMQTFPKPALFLHESDLVFDPKIRLQLSIERNID